MTKVKIITEKGVSAPKYATSGSAAVDLVANIKKPVLIHPGAAAQLIPTGIKLDMSDAPGVFGLLTPRSGLGHKHGLVLGNGVGVIDNDYQGEIMVSALNRNIGIAKTGMGSTVNNAPIVIEPGMRLAQLIFLTSIQVEFEKVESFEATERAEGGFGSTGTTSKTGRK